MSCIESEGNRFMKERLSSQDMMVVSVVICLSKAGPLLALGLVSLGVSRVVCVGCVISDLQYISNWLYGWIDL